MKRKIISLALILVMALSFLPITATAATVTFSDVKPQSWYYSCVNFVAEKGLMAGTSGGRFEPLTSMSRAMVVTILWHLEGDPYAYTNELSDVPANKWFSKPVAWAYRSGVVSGYGNGKFGTNDLVTREQLVTMLKNYTEFKDISTEKRGDLSKYTDASAISGWAADAVNWAVAEGLISGVGNGKLNPKGTASRAEAAAMMMNFYNNILTAEPEQPETPVTPDTPDVPETPDTPDLPADADKYDFAKNPIINNTSANQHAFPSYDIDSTGFVKSGTKLSDLKGKTLMLYTPERMPSFEYNSASGAVIDEWQWFDELKSELLVSIKKTVTSGASSVELPLRDMHAGKQCDIIYTTGANYPNALAISRQLDDYINTDNISKSMGICTNTMNMLKWGNTYRAISPIGAVDVLWYNKSMTSDLGLDDPHEMWQNGQWSWSSFDAFLKSVPERKANGDSLTAITHRAESIANVWPATTDTPAFYIDTFSAMPTIVNNWESSAVRDAWVSITSTLNSVKTQMGTNSDSNAIAAMYDFADGKIVMSGTVRPMLPSTCNDFLDWVPYPSKTSGDGIAQSLAYTMLLPKTTVKENNIDIALKFMELWANRFTEAQFDMLSSAPYRFSDAQKKEYFDFVNQNTVFALPMNDLYGMSPDPSGFYNSFTGNSSYNVTSQANSLSNSIMFYIIDSLKYGQ